MQFATLPALGQPLDGGIFAGITTTADGKHHAVVLLGAEPSKRLDWTGAQAWAAEQGGQLPTRSVSALLFANARDQFKPVWHWTSEAYADDDAYAWNQYFDFGGQLYDHKSCGAQARAVRLIHLDA
jgi:hypothetical protein